MLINVTYIIERGREGVLLKDLNELYKLHYKKVYGYLYGLTGKRELAEDLLQETFYKVYISLESFRGDSKVSTWIYQIAKYTYLNHNRCEIRDRKIDEALISTFPHSETPESKTVAKEEREELIKAIQSLPDIQRDVVILRVFNELSFRDVGEVFGKTENWAKVTYYRAKDKLVELLQKRGGNCGDKM